MVKVNLCSSGLSLDIQGKGKIKGDLVIRERKTLQGRTISLFGNMQHTITRPGKDVLSWNHAKVVPSEQNYNYNPYALPIAGGYFWDEVENKEEKHLKTTENKVKQISSKALEIADDFFDKTSVHGLQYLNSQAFNLFERIFWLISFSVACGFGAYFISLLYDDYRSSPVIVSFNPSLTSLNEIPFPAITICNVNIARRSDADRVRKFGSHIERRLLDDMCNLNNSFTNDTQEESANWGTFRSLVLSVNQKCSQMFKLCKWENNPVSCELYINSILTDEGYCCSFNRQSSNYTLRDVNPGDLNETYPGRRVDWTPEDGYPADAGSDVYPLRASGSGVHLGLSLVLDAGLDQYYCTSSSSVGFKVMIASPIETPKVAEYGFLLSPGVEARIPIQASIIESSMGIMSIDIEKRQCYFAKERKLQFYRIYTERNCKLECQAIYTLKKCGCVPYFLPKNASSIICGKRKEQCSNEARFAIERLSSPERKKCNCLPGCFSIGYRNKYISQSFLTTHYKIEDEDLLERETLDKFAESIVVAHFYYESDRFRAEIISELYGFTDFLSNVGGILGVFFGFSFISAWELLFFIFLKPFIKHKKPEDKAENHN